MDLIARAIAATCRFDLQLSARGFVSGVKMWFASQLCGALIALGNGSRCVSAPPPAGTEQASARPTIGTSWHRIGSCVQ